MCDRKSDLQAALSNMFSQRPAVKRGEGVASLHIPSDKD